MKKAEVRAELSLDLAPRIDSLLEQRTSGSGEKALAELTFANLWLFRRPHRWLFHDGDWPCISGIGYDGLAHAIPLFDLSCAPAAIVDQLLHRFGCLFPLSDAEVYGLDTTRHELTSQEYDSDYLYPAKQFRHYRGAVLHKKKNLMTQLLAANEVTATAYSLSLQADAERILKVWLQDKQLCAGDADDLPCREALALSNQLSLEGYVYFASDRPVGFLLSEELQPGVWVIRFAKGLALYKGISQYMFHHFASCTDRDVQWLNFEQDLDLPNFRKTKLSYQPSAMLRKWRLQLSSIGS